MERDQRHGYSYPVTDAFAEKVHTTAGVERLVTESNIDRLLQEMERDGYDVSAAVMELKALVNYVTHSKRLRNDSLSHLEYVIQQLKK